ncbi:lateral signaling target protein 2, partial [Podospora aff. communis PSN243]
CRYRTARHHDMECGRYFDCPTHLVERVLSNGGHGDEGHGRGEDNDAIMSDPVEEEEEEEERDGERQGGAPLAEGGDARPATPRPRPGDTAENPIVLGDSSPEVQRVSRPLASAQRATMNSADARQASEYRRSLQSRELTAREMLRQSMAAQPLSFPASQGQVLPPEQSFAAASRRGGPPEFTVPRWQPDAEVTYCPICHTQFSIWIRKHHCRKCGRVVCASCSPHRITIPHQYIVRPPWDASLQHHIYPMGEIPSPDFGGERVRLCNPCVPDPNIAPPQTPGGHSRSQSGLGQSPQSAGAQPNARWSSYFGYSPVSDPHIRSRSVTLQAGAPATLGRQGGSRQRPVEDRILSGTPPAYYQMGSGQSTNLPPGYGTVQRSRGTAAGSSSSSAFNRLLPLPPIPPAPPARDPQHRPSASTSQPSQPQRHEIAEEDECPVCHRELPSRTLPNFEALRESHITSCIMSHSSYSGAAGPSTGGEAPLPRLPPRRTGMFPYVATEKDCVDSAECTICLEEFEVGVPMARLECLCRFHRDCIRAWFERHPGRCPMHQHEDFGY